MTAIVVVYLVVWALVSMVALVAVFADFLSSQRWNEDWMGVGLLCTACVLGALFWPLVFPVGVAWQLARNLTARLSEDREGQRR